MGGLAVFVVFVKLREISEKWEIVKNMRKQEIFRAARAKYRNNIRIVCVLFAARRAVKIVSVFPKWFDSGGTRLVARCTRRAARKVMKNHPILRFFSIIDFEVFE